MALNPNAFVDGVMDGFSLHIEPPRISKGPKYRFPSNIHFPKCRIEIAASLTDFSNGWCKRENV